MKSFGFKIVDKQVSEIEPIVDHAIENENPIEIGFYFSNIEANESIWEKLYSCSHPINTHLDHRKYHLFSIHDHLLHLALDMEHYNELGSDYSVTHFAASPTSLRKETNGALYHHLMKNIRQLNDLCEKKHHPVHIENTFNNLEFYRELFSRIAADKLPMIHFCFDLGHAKAWSSNKLANWIGFLQDLEGEGFNLHFHLHNNHGSKDEHLSFLESEVKGLNKADNYTGQSNYMQALNKINKLFPNSRKIFEVKAELAIANMDFVSSHIAVNN